MHAPIATAMSSASWLLRMPSDSRPCDVLGHAGRWQVRVHRGTDDQLATLADDALTVNETGLYITLYGVRCPSDIYAAGCSFALRLKWALPIDSDEDSASTWTASSAPRWSRPLGRVAPGVERFEVRFADAGSSGSQWSSSAAQTFQSEAAKHMAVSERSVVIVERYAEGTFLVFDLVPLELELSHMRDRLVAALQRPNRMGVAELRKLLPSGRAQLLFAEAPPGLNGAPGAFGLLTHSALHAPWVLPACLCLCFVCAWRQRATCMDNMDMEPGRGKPARLRQVDRDDEEDEDNYEDEDESYKEGEAEGYDGGHDRRELRVQFAAECGEAMQVLLPLAGIESEIELRSAIWERGDALMAGDQLPPENMLRLSFIDRRGSQRPLSASTPWSDVRKARRINVTCSKLDDDEESLRGSRKKKRRGKYSKPECRNDRVARNGLEEEGTSLKSPCPPRTVQDVESEAMIAALAAADAAVAAMRADAADCAMARPTPTVPVCEALKLDW